MFKFLFSCSLLFAAYTLVVLAKPNAVKIPIEDVKEVEKPSGKTKRGVWDGLFSLFDYEEGDDDDSDEKYLICRNCTVLLQPQNDSSNAEPPKVVAPVQPVVPAAVQPAAPALAPPADPAPVPAATPTAAETPPAPAPADGAAMETASSDPM